MDEDFRRGESAYDRYYGDPTNKPNPNLGEISHGPYYAAKMVPGDLGTKGGIVTDIHGRALRDDGSVIEGFVCRRQCQRTGDGPHVSGTRRHDRTRNGVRVSGGAAPGGEGLRCRSTWTKRSARSSIRVEFSWSSSDIQLYHLGLGAGQDPMDQRELRYLVDDIPQVLPTFGNVAASFHDTAPPTVKFPGIDIELSRVLHASEAVIVPGPLPPSGTGRAVTRFTDIWDKGKAAVIWSETTVTTPDGTPLWTQKRSIFARGEGGFGGERGPSTSSEPPERAPDFELSIAVSPQQALLYRMCGDRNPLHSDPEFASAAGFPRPILHGLCTYGMTCKAMVDALLDGDTARVGSVRRAVSRASSSPVRR